MPTAVASIFEVADYRAQIQDAARLLREGKLVVLPTETVYGAAGLLRNPEALSRLKGLRGNDGDKPFTIHLAKCEDATKYLGPTSDLGKRMMTKLWPGPVAIQFDVPDERRKEVAKTLNVAESELYEDGTITLRCPDHLITSDVLAEVDGPIVITRAGLEASQIARDLDGKVDLIIDAGPSRYSKPSTIVRVKDGRYEIVRSGIYDERIIERLLRTTVLFVCSGNTCRSPMSEAIARRVLADKLHVGEDELESKGISVISAGSFALPGARATPAAVDALKAMGVDLSRHRSRPLSVELIHQADVIYTMSKNHAQAVAALVPSASQKTKTLDPDKDVEDPIGGDLSLYQELAVELKQLIEKRLEESVPV
jgi:tRNA threonylcarbamoyl adenosine modification protein (Sua5/YciO/YrdC/YwlC family)